MAKETFTCKVCGENGIDHPSKNRQFCSRVCWQKHRAIHGMAKKPKTGRHDPCQVCGSAIWRVPSDVEHDRRWTCSRACAAVLLTTAEWVERKCAQCGESMGLRRESDRRRSCSKKCATALRTVNAIDRIYNGVPARTNSTGYVLVYEPTHPKAQGAGWVYEHRLVAERMVGRILLPEEIVHHINRVKDDNREENLAIVDSKTHARFTANERMSDRALLYEYMRRFGPIDV